jgi:pimeloyl-ACP methyl ester carboxylesterase
MAIKNVSVVLAHGAWADGSSWARVITALKAEAVNVVAAPLPLTSLADDAAALNRSLDRTEGPIVLAGHAYAGAVIALARPERVKALVYVTALAPDQGEKGRRVLSPRTSSPGAKARTRQQWSDLAARSSLRDGVRAKCIRGRPSSSRCCAAADFAGLHHCSSRTPALEGRSELVSGCRRRPDDRARNAALHGGADEGEDQGACRRSHAQRHRSNSGR